MRAFLASSYHYKPMGESCLGLRPLGEPTSSRAPRCYPCIQQVLQTMKDYSPDSYEQLSCNSEVRTTEPLQSLAILLMPRIVCTPRPLRGLFVGPGPQAACQEELAIRIFIQTHPE